MKRSLLLLLACVLAAWNASARAKQEKSHPDKREGVQSSGAVPASAKASSQSEQNSAKLSTGMTIEAALSSSLDARKCKEGDPLIAHTVHAVKSGGGVVLPKGSKLIGHVTQAKARAKGESASALGIVFEKAVLKDGQEIPISATVQAIAAAQTGAASSLGESTPGAMSTPGSATSSGGGLVGTAGSVAGAAAGTVGNAAGNVGTAAGTTVGSTANATGSPAGTMAGTSASAPLSSSSVGMIGLEGLSLTSSASSSTQGSVIASSTKNVHLDSGTRVLLRVQGKNE